MVLLTHIAIALSSILFATFLYVKPSKNRFYGSYALVALTLISGTYLVLSMHANLVQACTSGLVYLLIVSFGIAAARRKANADN
jgi:hypothetical protein